jgi:mono/diheme cytochrome c family protein
MMKRSGIAFLFLGFALAGCSRQTEKPVLQYFPHMSNTPILKAQRGYDGFGNGASVLMPPEHTVSRNPQKLPYRIETPEEAEAKLVNPMALTQVNLERGRELYNIYCMVCHGPKGHGDGPIVNPYPIPKSLHSENMLKWKDGHLFHVITVGQGVMPNYAQQIQPLDRWAIVNYVRALQRAENPSKADVDAFKDILGK